MFPSDSVPTSPSIWVSGFVQHAVVEYRLPALRNFTPQLTICSGRTVDVTPDDEGYFAFTYPRTSVPLCGSERCFGKDSRVLHTSGKVTWFLHCARVKSEAFAKYGRKKA